MSTVAQGSGSHPPHLSVLGWAYLLDGLFLALLAPAMSLVVAFGDGGEFEWSWSTVLVAGLFVGAALSAVAAGAVAAVGLARQRPHTTVGRWALAAACANALVLPLAGVIAILVSETAAQGVGMALWLTFLSATILAGVAYRRSDRVAALVVPFMIGVTVAAFVVGELVGHE